MNISVNSIVGVVMVLIVWWVGVTILWNSDMRLAAVGLAAPGVAAIGGAIVGLYQKFANGRW